MKIVIDTVDHKDMINYPSVGDWRYDEDGILHIKVAKLSNEKYECLVALHEFIEALSCRYNNITQQEVDIFDENYEMNRPDGNVDEPGDDPEAPYVVQHCLATGVERILAQQWGVKWKVYENEINSL
jgi:hypothetical protein